MANTRILISIHGRRLGLNSEGKLVANGKLVPTQTDAGSIEQVQEAPGTLNTTGTLTIALIRGGIVTSTTAASVTATLDTGAVCDAAVDMAVNDAFDWAVINTGGANAITVTAAASGHTVVGAGAVAANTSGHFRTRKTAADTFVTYRIS